MSEEMVQIVQKAVMVLVQLAVPPLLAFLIGQLRQWIELRRQESWWRALEVAVRDAVAAAEQLGLTDQLEALADSKLQYAIDYVERQMALKGIPVDLDPYIDVIRGMIEAEVRRQFPHTAQAELAAIG